ncbi:virulence-associated E family protein [Qipengyuania citrea]|uniref:VapE domain-containing protein n=1 Tax=Qipengyuania citrea TaxID=225971 RepID=UPI001E589CDE|nr:VapE domain-containing protein [Qipengyuania citrea]MCD1591824.1 virulence-associated E family protein [Qipengyuania citrea]
MKTEDGVKPQLEVVASNDDVTPDYQDGLIEVVKALAEKHIKKEKIELHEVVRFLDPAEDNQTVCDWLVTNKICKASEFEKALKQAKRRERLERELGFVPKDVVDFVMRWAEQNKIILTPRGIIKQERPAKIGDMTITAQEAKDVPEAKRIFDIHNASASTLDAIARKLRLANDKLELGYRDGVISDALDEWQEKVITDASVEAFQLIAFQKGKATGEIGAAMWADLERACFDVSDSCQGFAVAVLKKFMWQVKRKARGMDVTNHLMPVLTGSQGKGKSTFVEHLIAPLGDLTRKVDFGLLSDGKTKDIWSASILFIDEMGFFSKADVDQVKNLITSNELSIRTMRTNRSDVVRNCATLIGCTNKSLGELVRDDTGVRRFAELRYSNDPDWAFMQTVDWIMLWQSVDEEGPDPVIEANMMTALKSQQESNRNQCPVELWATEFGKNYKDWTRASDLHETFREWEDIAFPRAQTNQTNFGKTLTRLIGDGRIEMEKKVMRNGVNYRAGVL